MCDDRYDIVMLGTFGLWRLGTLQARALPIARELVARGYRCAIVTSPWDMPHERGVVEVRDGVVIVNTASAGRATAPAVRQQIGMIRRFRPRIVHLFKPRGFGGLAARRLLGSVPVIVDSDDWEGDGGWNQRGGYSLAQRRLFDWQERSLIRDADGVTAASALLARRAVALRAETGGVWRMPNGLASSWVDELAEPRRRADGRPAGAPVVVLYSRFEEFDEGWPAQFAALLRMCVPEVRVVAVGGGVAEGVERLGYVARHLLPDILGTATVAVYPYQDSLITRSKQSVKLLELMAAGCAVVASDVGDVPAVVGEAGRTIRGHDAGRFAEVSAVLLSEPGICRALGEAAQARVRECFTIPAVVNDLERVYQRFGLVAR